MYIAFIIIYIPPEIQLNKYNIFTSMEVNIGKKCARGLSTVRDLRPTQDRGRRFLITKLPADE